jgi:glycosyltransferase involved in cell wall biosynthesis
MEPYKGLDVLVRAFAAVRKSLPDWKLVLAGSGHVPPGSMGDGSDGIQILNRYITNVEVTGLMQRARFVVLPYTAATQSGVIAIAYALGLPVIASNVGGLNEMVLEGMTGLLVPANDPRSLERAILALATRRNLVPRMRKHILSMGRHELNPLRIAREHAQLYANVLVGHTGP